MRDAIGILLVLTAGASSCGGEVQPRGSSSEPDAAMASRRDSGLGEDATTGDASGASDAIASEDAPFDAPVADDDGTPAHDAGVDALPPYDAGSCDAGAVQCVGDALQSCPPSGQWTPPVPCSQPTPTCVSGACTCSSSICAGQCVDTQTDDANCGGCGLACPSGCAGGECVVILATAAAPVGFTVASDGAYWADGSDLKKVPLDGGAPVTLSTVGAAFPAVCGDTVYWGGGNGGTNPHGIYAVATDGGTAALLAPDFTPAGVACDGTNVYWCDTGNRLLAIASSGGQVSTLATDCSSQALQVVGGRIYWPLQAGLTSVAVDGGAEVTVASLSQDGCTVSGGEIYWSSPTAIGTAALDGSHSITLTTGQSHAFQPVPDGANPYWELQGAFFGGVSGIVRMPIGGGTPTTLVTRTAPPYSQLFVDATSVYWLEQNAVLKMTPK